MNNNKQEENKNLIAVYGSLRRSLGNHRLIQHSKYLGTFNTEPIFSLYSLGGFPGLKENGNTSVVMEVYEVDDQTAKSVDGLEGYSPNRVPTFYDKIQIQTPYGQAGVYIYVSDIPENRKVESGDWVSFLGKKHEYRSIMA